MEMQAPTNIGAIAQPKVATTALLDAKPRKAGFLFGPVVDFLCLGGSSLLLFPLILMLPEVEYREQFAAVMLVLAFIVNYPHFAHSYQIFYRGYSERAFNNSLGRTMQARYLFAGLFAPALLASFLAYGAVAPDVQLLGYGANLMVLTVGWHYVKQGYGMLMVDAALKRRFFNEGTKKIMLVNCYTVWLAAWVSLNVAINKQDFLGLAYYSFAVPQPLYVLTCVAAFISTALMVWALTMHWKEKGSLPTNGLIAYGVSLYLWLVFARIDPLWALLVPTLHSLQYLIVVWRFQLNYEKANLASEDYLRGSIIRSVFGNIPAAHMTVFVLLGGFLGLLGFWGIPLLAQGFVPYDQQATSTFLFFFIFWIFINVHHYFLDNVMWRRENPDTRLYLFGQ